MCSITIRELCLADRHNLFYNSAFLRIRNKDGRAGLSVLCLPQTDSILQSLHRDALPPQMDTTGMFTNDARCILAASITSMTSILLMRANSIFMVSLPAVEMTLGKCWAHSSNTLISFFPPPNKKIFVWSRADRCLRICSCFDNG